MKKRNEDLLIILVGGPLFGVLVHWKFPGAPGLLLKIGAGLVVMVLIVALRRLVGEQTWPRYLAVSFAAGMMMGSALWWLTSRQHPWIFYALPGGLFVLVYGTFDRLTGRRRSRPV